MNLLLIESEPFEGRSGPTTIASGTGMKDNIGHIEERLVIHMKYDKDFFGRALAVGDDFIGWYVNFFS